MKWNYICFIKTSAFSFQIFCSTTPMLSCLSEKHSMWRRSENGYLILLLSHLAVYCLLFTCSAACSNGNCQVLLFYKKLQNCFYIYKKNSFFLCLRCVCAIFVWIWWTPCADPCNFEFWFVGLSWNLMNIVTASWVMCFSCGLWTWFILWELSWIGKESAVLYQRTDYWTHFHCKLLSLLYSPISVLGR